MSLINDALRRADEQHKQAEPPAPPPAKPLQPVVQKSRAWLPVVLGMIVLLLVLALAAWFLSKWWEAQKHKAKKPVPTVVPAEIPKPKEPEVPVEPPHTNPPPVVVEPPPPPPPKTNVILRLQGVFIRTSKPSALINGKTVFVGGKIFDAQVLSIQPDQVTVEEDGVTNVLILK